jgi:hypothetical protein
MRYEERGGVFTDGVLCYNYAGLMLANPIKSSLI